MPAKSLQDRYESLGEKGRKNVILMLAIIGIVLFFGGIIAIIIWLWNSGLLFPLTAVSIGGLLLQFALFLKRTYF